MFVFEGKYENLGQMIKWNFISERVAHLKAV